MKALHSHTRAPWRRAGTGVEAQAFDGSWKYITPVVHGGNPEQANANRDLIAAAPELLAICRRFAVGDMRLPHTEYEMELRAEARAIVAKAEGRSLERQSAQPCGCDPDANWICETHRSVPDAHLGAGIEYVEAAAVKYLDNSLRRAWVIQQLMERFGIPESIARLITELAVTQVKNGIKEGADQLEEHVAQT